MLARMLGRMESLQEFRDLVDDLFSNSEDIMLIRRLFVARMMMDGEQWRTIKKTLGAGETLLKEVSARLARGGRGFEIAIKRLHVVEEELAAEVQAARSQEDPASAESLMQKHTRFFWPYLAAREAPKIGKNIAAGIKRKKSMNMKK